MTEPADPIFSSTRDPSPALVAQLQQLKPGQRIEITQTIRVGSKVWTATVVGTFRKINYLVTGLATDRLPEDDIIVPALHFTKEPHGELSTVTLDENTKIKVLEG